ncbi:MAG: hypothetical protein JSW73_05060 [Candidatus Woesearchaeota archaeon]|nr:MAG: hypothetical protein JSW73_05060 [Candidatus Woesearchaeota archaeon]
MILRSIQLGDNWKVLESILASSIDSDLYFILKSFRPFFLKSFSIEKIKIGHIKEEMNTYFSENERSSIEAIGKSMRKYITKDLQDIFKLK